MSKTFTYVLIVIGAYIAIIAGKALTGKKTGTETKQDDGVTSDLGDGMKDETDENGVSKGAKGQLNYRFGATK